MTAKPNLERCEGANWGVLGVVTPRQDIGAVDPVSQNRWGHRSGQRVALQWKDSEAVGRHGSNTNTTNPSAGRSRRIQ